MLYELCSKYEVLSATCLLISRPIELSLLERIAACERTAPRAHHTAERIAPSSTSPHRAHRSSSSSPLGRIAPRAHRPSIAQPHRAHRRSNASSVERITPSALVILADVVGQLVVVVFRRPPPLHRCRRRPTHPAQPRASGWGRSPRRKVLLHWLFLRHELLATYRLPNWLRMTHTCIYVYVHTWIHVYMYKMYTCGHVYTYAYIHVCMCARVHA